MNHDGPDGYMSEGYALSDNYDGDCEDAYEEFLEDRAYSIQSDRDHYDRNKKAKVGTLIECAENRCHKQFVKKSYQQAFCCTKHKDQFWNRQRL